MKIEDQIYQAKTYLGDGAYAVIDEFGDLCIQAENGSQITQIVVIDKVSYIKLEEFIQLVREIGTGRW